MSDLDRANNFDSYSHPKMHQSNISKSRFLSGAQCKKKLYFDVFRKELKPEVSLQQQALFDTGQVS